MAYNAEEQVFYLESPDVAAELTRYVGLQLDYSHTFKKETYKSMAEATGVSATTISKIARGKSYYPQIRTVFPILSILDMEFDPRRKAIVLRASTNVVKIPGKQRA